MKKTLWITQTAALIALLVLLQSFTKAGGQLLTGSCVNGILAVAALFVGVQSGITVAVISPFFAYLLGIGPQLLPIVPAIAAGNLTYVLLLHLLSGKQPLRKAVSLTCAALCKFLTLYLLVVQLLCRILPLQEKQIAVFSAMFSWPQLITAFAGGGLALLIVPVLRKVFRR